MNQYMIFVQGKEPPKRVHESLSEAIKEVNRLSEIEGFNGRTIYLLKVEGVYRPTYRWTDASDDLTAHQVSERMSNDTD